MPSDDGLPFGRYPIHQKLTVLGSDVPGNRVLDFKVFEYMGTEVSTPDAPKDALLRREDLREDMIILVRGLGGFLKMVVRRDDTGELCAESESRMVAYLEFDIDDRHCWVCTGMSNMKGIANLKLCK